MATLFTGSQVEACLLIVHNIGLTSASATSVMSLGRVLDELSVIISYATRFLMRVYGSALVVADLIMSELQADFLCHSAHSFCIAF